MHSSIMLLRIVIDVDFVVFTQHRHLVKLQQTQDIALATRHLY